MTTILSELSIPGLPFASSREAAMYAVKHDEWRDLPEDQAVLKISRHFSGVWASRAALGTLIHSVAESYAHGEDVDLEVVLTDMLDNNKDAQLWKTETFDDLMERSLGYVLGLEKFWAEFQPRVAAVEAVVREPGVYIGTGDLVATVKGRWADGTVSEALTLFDYKTTAHQDEAKGLYPDAWSLQLHAYGFARERVHYREEDGRVREVGTSVWKQPERFVVIHLRGDESYHPYEIPRNEETFNRFLDLASLYRWRKALSTAPTCVLPVAA